MLHTVQAMVRMRCNMKNYEVGTGGSGKYRSFHIVKLDIFSSHLVTPMPRIPGVYSQARGILMSWYASATTQTRELHVCQPRLGLTLLASPTRSALA